MWAILGVSKKCGVAKMCNMGNILRQSKTFRLCVKFQPHNVETTTKVTNPRGMSQTGL